MLLKIIFAYTGTVACAVFYNTRPKKLPLVGILGILSWAAYTYFTGITHSAIVATFVAALMTGICSEFLARWMKSPSLVFSIAGTTPLLPGFSSYTTAKLILEGNFTEAAPKAVTTLFTAGTIALGIMLATAFFRIFRDLKTSS